MFQYFSSKSLFQKIFQDTLFSYMLMNINAKHNEIYIKVKNMPLNKKFHNF